LFKLAEASWAVYDSAYQSIIDRTETGMEFQQQHGVFETVPEFSYGTYVRVRGESRLVGRRYEGHTRLLASFASKREAELYEKDKVTVRNRAATGGYLQMQEYSYKMETTVQYEIAPVDVIPSVACA